jgi:hypothetical protein
LATDLLRSNKLHNYMDILITLSWGHNETFIWTNVRVTLEKEPEVFKKIASLRVFQNPKFCKEAI